MPKELMSATRSGVRRAAPAALAALLLVLQPGVPTSLWAQARVERAPAKVRVKPKVRSIKPLRGFIKANRTGVVRAVKAAGGSLEVHREGNHRLLVTESGGLAVQRVDQRKAGAKRVRLDLLFPYGKFPSLDGEALLLKLRREVGRAAEGGKPRGAKAAPDKGEPLAVLPDGSKAPPSTMLGGYHGTSLIKPEVALRQGLPGRGDDWRLKEHSESAGNSAFRGVTQMVFDPISGNGAAAWAGAGGWVYDVRGVPGWDVNALLEGRVKRPGGGGFRGNLMYGEQETAIPARVPAERIKAYGKVEQDSQGRLLVREWIPNPAYKAPGGATAAGGAP